MHIFKAFKGKPFLRSLKIIILNIYIFDSVILCVVLFLIENDTINNQIITKGN